MTPPPIRLEALEGDDDGRRRAPSASRNRAEILPELARVLPPRGTVLEIASGTGEHAVFFARALPEVDWQPTERDAEALASIAAWRAHEGSSNLRTPLRLDVLADAWPVATADAIVAINVLHITPWAFTERLFAGAARALVPGGPLCIYGAMFHDDREPEPSNLEFDERLRATDPAYGVRRLAAVAECAHTRGLTLAEAVDMPNRNTLAVFRRAPASDSRAPR